MEKILRIFDLERPDAPPQQLTGATKGFRNVAFVQNDTLLITTQQDTPGIDVWDVKSGQIVRSLATEAPVSSIDVSGRGCAWGWGWG